MPTTFTGLLLFVVLLLPGFVYLVGKERAGTERRTSPFRETVSIVAASSAAELSVVVISSPAWASIMDVDRLLTDLPGYWHDHARLLALWFVGLLLAAIALAYAATRPALRHLVERIGGEYPHPSAVSAWWMLFHQLDPSADKQVGCVLDDGSYIEGNLVSFNIDASDIADRDIILGEPVKYRPAGDDIVHSHPASAVCISARQISIVFVTYLDPAEEVTSSAEEAEEKALPAAG